MDYEYEATEQEKKLDREFREATREKEIERLKEESEKHLDELQQRVFDTVGLGVPQMPATEINYYQILEDKEFNTLKLDSIDTYQFPLNIIENISFKNGDLVIKLKKGYENE